MAPQLPLCCSSNGFDLLKRQLPVLNSSDALLQRRDRHRDAPDRRRRSGDVDATASGLRRPRPLARPRPPAAGDPGAPARVPLRRRGVPRQHGRLLQPRPTATCPRCCRPSAACRSRSAWSTRSSPSGSACGPGASGCPGTSWSAWTPTAGTILVDPFAGGRIFTTDEAHDRMEEMFGPEVEWSEELLRPASNRHWLTRMLQNLLNVFGSAGRYNDVAAVLEMEMLLWPEQSHLQRDLGLVLARCGLPSPASIWLDRYLQKQPGRPAETAADGMLTLLRVQGSSPQSSAEPRLRRPSRRRLSSVIWPKYACSGLHAPAALSASPRSPSRRRAFAPVIVVKIGTLFSTAIARILPSSVCGPFFVGVLMISWTSPFLIVARCSAGPRPAC